MISLKTKSETLHIEVQAVAAINRAGVIGKKDSMELPWPSAKNDLKWFRKITADTIMVAGFKTYWGLASLDLDLSNGRELICYGRKDHERTQSFLIDTALKYKKTISIIGGADTYRRFSAHTDRWIISRIDDWSGMTRTEIDNFVFWPQDINMTGLRTQD